MSDSTFGSRPSSSFHSEDSIVFVSLSWLENSRPLAIFVPFSVFSFLFFSQVLQRNDHKVKIANVLNLNVTHNRNTIKYETVMQNGKR
jgi:hypothetical protein